jgi:hypothetical protein
MPIRGGCFLLLTCQSRGGKARAVMTMNAGIIPYYVHLPTSGHVRRRKDACQ